ncbi:curved DNA-binding protein [Pseudomonas sp. R3.Fl]|uniref:curved DNA-binding protein n=1 Tax=Pseudomonas sp. R3.Fl TaxID=2928708 RepID=UPI00201DC735|nr:curved DNA-binding protein [Pseudomonas sp. R3.Fl]MCL6690912.1 curved DNA-binding protein [Pseudomonas sp. R3.Fl]
MDFKDYYAALGVAPDADEKAIKTAYRKLARKYHPDVSKEADAEAHFKEVSEAYEVLKSPEKRAEYDQLRQYQQSGRFEAPPGWQPSGGFEGAEHFQEQDFSDFFESIFGAHAGPQAHRRREARGRDIELEVPLFLEESQSGEPQPIRFGLPSYDEQGRRRPDVEKTLKVRIPPGVVDGERIRLKGQGAPGIGGAPAGDLYLIIRLAPHPLFDVDGRDLVLSVPLAPWEAALGAKIEVPTLNGRIALSVPPGSQSGQRLRIRGKGLAGKGEDPAGDLYAVLKVVMPKGAPEGETRKHWEELAARAAFDPRSQWGKRP